MRDLAPFLSRGNGASHQSGEIERLTAPFAHHTPTISPQDLKFPPELQPNTHEDLQTMANYISQLHYHPPEIIERLEHERGRRHERAFRARVKNDEVRVESLVIGDDDGGDALLMFR